MTSTLFFKALVECLNTGGVIIVDVPNNSIEKHLEVRRRRHIAGYHFHFFNKLSLTGILKRHNLETISVYAYGPKKWEQSGINLIGIFRYRV